MIKEGEPRSLIESVAIGVVGALSAQLFMLMLRASNYLFLQKLAGYRPPGLSEDGGSLHQVIGPHGLWLIPVATTVGGLISGALVYGFAPEAEGHGTDTVVNAFHRNEGNLRPRVAPIKMLASAITIGSGGAAGREGPIALISAGVASFFAMRAHRTEEERRLLLLAGMAAGLSAIFRTPMGTGVFAIEVLYGNMEFEIGAFLYTMVSSAVAYTVNGLFVGWGPLFHLPAVATPGLSSYAWFAVLGIASGLVGTLLPMVFYRTRDAFRRLPIPTWTKPGLGALCVGLLALRVPQILGGGYGWIQEAIDGRLAVKLLFVLLFTKMIAFSLTVSSGGSGGVFAPSLFIGAMLGAGFSILFHQPTAVFAIVGMAAVFGSAARVPVATMLMVTEMAGGYHLLVPAGLAVMIAYLLQSRLSSVLKYRSLYEAQVPTRNDSPAHYLEEIQTGLNLLGRRDMPLTDKLGHLDLLRLLRARVRFDLPGGRQLTMGELKEDSSFVGKTIKQLYEGLRGCEFEIIAIRRREHILLPHPATILEAKDRILFIEAPQLCEELHKHVTPLPPSAQTMEPTTRSADESASASQPDGHKLQR
ncbi:MAG: chloride channel protein [Candidatus Sulfotelmatobacter sp.]